MLEALVLSMDGLEALAVVHGLTRESLVCTWMTDIVGRLRYFVSPWEILYETSSHGISGGLKSRHGVVSPI